MINVGMIIFSCSGLTISAYCAQQYGQCMQLLHDFYKSHISRFFNEVSMLGSQHYRQPPFPPHPPCYIGPDLCKLDFMHTFCNIYQGQKYCILLGALNSVTSVVLQKLKPIHTEKLHCSTVGSLPQELQKQK